MTTKTKTPRSIQAKLLELYCALVDYLLNTVRTAKPGTLRPSLLAVVRLVLRDAGIMQAVRNQAQAKAALESLRGEVDDAAQDMALPFSPPRTKQ